MVMAKTFTFGQNIHGRNVRVQTPVAEMSEHRPGPTVCLSCSGSKLLDSLMVFLIFFLLEKVFLKKKKASRQQKREKLPCMKEQI